MTATVFCLATLVAVLHVCHGQAINPAGTVRLIGVSPFMGRVDVRVNGEWGTVCDDDWGDVDASVVCRELGYGEGTALSGVSRLVPPGEDFTPIHFDNMACVGNETTIVDCAHNGLGIHNCGHREDAGVMCKAPLSLRGGASEFEGMVSVTINKTWYPICADDWSIVDAEVVCQSLGFGNSLRASSVAGALPEGSLFTFGGINCTGDDQNLFSCPINTTVGSNGGYPCPGNLWASTHCSVPLRLQNGTSPMEGRVEVVIDGSPLAVCDNEWTMQDGTVICRQLGYTEVARILFGGAATGLFGPTSATQYLQFPQCTGNETTLTQCTFGTSNGVDCSAYPVAVTCRNPDYSQMVRLVDGNHMFEGRVEIQAYGQWGTVCDDSWDQNDAQVVCNQLGLGEAAAWARNAAFGPGFLPIFLDDVNCNNTEATLQACNHRGYHTHNCHHNEDAGVVCKPPIRLVGGDVAHEGRIEISVKGQWGAVCFQSLDVANGNVACRQMGLGPAISVPPASKFGGANSLVFLNGVQCLSDEAFLGQCQTTPLTTEGCPEQAAVRCSLPLRLVNGTSAYGGVVQMQTDGTWDGICDSNWTMGDASVVCRQLGMSSAMATEAQLQAGADLSAFTVGTPRNYLCDGSEPTLSNCNSRPEPDTCTQPVTVTCSPSVRLANGSTPYEGRVEVLINGTWGTICDDQWDLTDAQVLCRQLGYGYARSAYSEARFGPGAGPIFFDNVQCTGFEHLLSECSNGGLNNHNCNHQEDAGVSCELQTVVAESVRLVDGPTDHEGRVEILWQGSWGTVCDDDWTLPDATVVCRELGFSGATEAPRQATYGPGSGPIILDNVQCVGSEATILNCVHNGFLNHNCGHDEDAGAICIPQDNTTSAPTTVPSGGVADWSVRLVDGSTEYEGRVEVFLNGEWGTVCDDLWDTSDGSVVCLQLGYGPVIRATQGADFGPGTGAILLDNVYCEGTEDTLETCRSNGVGIHNCAHTEDAGLECRAPGSVTPAPSVNVTDGDIRLVDGMVVYEGRVEVYYGGQWGTVCDDLWDLQDAQVVCRQLGYGPAVQATVRGSFGRGTGAIAMDNVMCNGDEERLDACSHNGFTIHNCGHSEDAGVTCAYNASTRGAIAEEGDLRLVDGETDLEGRVEVFKNSVWGTVCDDLWGVTDAGVVCTQLGLGPAIAAFSSAHFGPGTGMIHFDNVDCTGSETRLIDCARASQQNCNHGEDAGVQCSPPVGTNTSTETVERGAVRLVGGAHPSEGRVEVYINGWGTVCDDMWGLEDALVVCRQLGFQNATEAITAQTRFGAGDSDMPIMLDNVQCFGTENNLLECPSNEPGSHNCGHSEDAGVVCHTPGLRTNGSVRILSPSTAPGLVNIQINDQWEIACFGPSWTTNEGMVVCRQLSMGFVINVYSVPVPESYTRGLTQTRCQGHESNLLECDGATMGPCDSNLAGAVQCSTSEAFVGVRLIGSAEHNPAEGRVEVFINGSWSSVCGSSWSQSEAGVICHQLGFGPAINRSPGLIAPGPTVATPAPMKLTEVSCNETATHFVECAYTFLAEPIATCLPAEVVCSPSDTAVPTTVRLVDGINAMEGRVEVYKNGVWGTVCDDNWDLSEALVVCRQLGYHRALEAPGGARFGQGTGPIHMDNVNCVGTETQLLDCSHLDTHNCGHGEDAGVVCNADDTSTTIRLVGGTVPNEGRVEVLYDGVWGTVCDDSWDLSDANVVCRQLGLGSAQQATWSASFGPGEGPIHLDNVACSGEEVALQSCSHNGVGTHNCNHGEDAGVTCNVLATIGPQATVRLVGGQTPAEGRVEVFWSNAWGTVCDDEWGIEDARVVCTQLGYPDAISAPTNARFGQGTGSIFLDNVGCVGTEPNLLECPLGHPIGTHNCGHSEDAGVTCSIDGPPAVPVRLVDGETPDRGRVEIYHEGEWGTVCDDLWDINDASVVCRQLGYLQAESAVGGAAFGMADSKLPILLDNLGCFGTEDSLMECSNSGIGVHNCGHQEDAGAICTNTADAQRTIRLVGTESPFKGRVEVYLDSQWGTVCDDGWDMNDAQVACRQLGYGGAVDYASSAQYGRGTGAILLDDVSCAGTESLLSMCSHRGIGSHNCGHSEDAGVICMPEMRLVNGSLPHEGRLEVSVGGQWGSVCNEGWGMDEADMACNQLGFGMAAESSADLPGAYFGPSTGPVHLTGVNCDSQVYLFLCEAMLMSGPDTSCDHSRDVSVICSDRVMPDVSVRLVGGPTPFKGRAEVFYNGTWGTICDDYWDTSDAGVFCRMLGYEGAIEAPRYAHFGRGFGPVLLDDMECTGEETSIFDCDRLQGPSHCSHSEDAGASCIPTVRLAGDSNRYRGRVEILVNDEWQGICGDNWSISNARVVCTQLSFGMAAQGPVGTMFGESEAGFYFMTPSCGGYESSLGSCYMTTMENCTTGYAGAICSLPEEGTDIRLVGGETSYEGRVEIGVEGNWGTICSNGWDKMDANVICRQLGTARATSAGRAEPRFGAGSGPIYLDNVDCGGSEANIALCSSSGVEVHNCSHKDDAAVSCTPPVRLVGGASPFEGRVEVYRLGAWGTVCDDAWGMEDARVVCRQLGFGAARAVMGTEGLRQTYNTIHMDEVACIGNETTLMDCPHEDTHDCTHEEDAGVQCWPPDMVCDLPALSQFTHISILKTSFDHGERVEIMCEDGSAAVILTCGDGGKWDGPGLTCKPPQASCSLPRNLPPGTVLNTVQTVFQVGQTLEVVCDTASSTSTSSVQWVCMLGGGWAQSEIVCASTGGSTGKRTGRNFNIPLFVCVLLAIIALIIIIVAVVLIRRYRRERLMSMQAQSIGMENVNSKYSNVNYANPSYDPSADPQGPEPPMQGGPEETGLPPYSPGDQLDGGHTFSDVKPLIT